MTEEQRMEEGRRYVPDLRCPHVRAGILLAYKEKVAKEGQVQLLEELDEESQKDSRHKGQAKGN